ncbi:MAG TPA: P1 family peptidase [Alphaproteobacteria bacterium]|nr:P1 family peptidase [Alphaproteobacteria bacterium]
MPRPQELAIETNAGADLLEMDFPSLRIGTADYPAGPTGATVFWFPERAVGAVDVRGGAPGTYNLDWLRQGHEFPNLDAIAISGGSWYGLGVAAGVSAALKEKGHRSGHWANLATVVGAIVYDFGTRRLTSCHPDERLGAAALAAALPGRFPQGAYGAGRNTMQGSYFGLWLHSGQGGAFQQIGPTKIAAFAVVNAVGVVVNREGAIHRGNQRIPGGERHVRELLAQVPETIRTQDGSIFGLRRKEVISPANTTISIVATNQKITYAQLQRLATQVHMSMSRAIQPFATANDGDVLFAVSTAEVDHPELHPTDLGVVASEVMWSAILNSVPAVTMPTDPGPPLSIEAIGGMYALAPGVNMEVHVRDPELVLTVRGSRDVFDIQPGASVRAAGRAVNTFAVDHPFLESIRFVKSPQGAVDLLLNPGHWQQQGTRL